MAVLNCPWDVKCIEDFLYYCCPECSQFRSQSRDDFLQHAEFEHPDSKDYLYQFHIKDEKYDEDINEENVELFSLDVDENGPLMDQKQIRKNILLVKEEDVTQEMHEGDDTNIFLDEKCFDKKKEIKKDKSHVKNKKQQHRCHIQDGYIAMCRWFTKRSSFHERNGPIFV